jgi:hypothetical protein
MTPAQAAKRARALFRGSLTVEQLREMRTKAHGAEADAIAAALTWRSIDGRAPVDRARHAQRDAEAVAAHDDTTAFDVSCAREDEEAEHRNWLVGEVSGSDAYRFRDDDTGEF